MSVVGRLRSGAGDAVRRAHRALWPDGWSGTGYWERRARRFGAEAVVNVDRSSAEVAEITEVQQHLLLPPLESLLDGTEELVLDFGCGPGGFTPDLAGIVGRAIGVDPVQGLLDLASRAPGAEYLLMSPGRLPLADGEVDVVWSCLALGAVTDGQMLTATVEESMFPTVPLAHHGDYSDLDDTISILAGRRDPDRGHETSKS